MKSLELIATLVLLVGMVIAAALLIRSIRKDRTQKQVIPTDPARRPFPQHERYLDDTVFPGQFSQATRDTLLSERYQQWKKRWILPDLELGRSFMRMGITKQGLRYRMLVTSEGQGLAMLCSVIFSGNDLQAQGTFNQLLAYCKAHPSQKHPDLMSWQVIAEAFPSIATDSATRGDLLIAYALLMADKQWGSAGRVNYLASAKTIIAALKEQCVHPYDFHMLQGNWVNEYMEGGYAQTNRSCMSPLIFKAFQKASGDLTWQKVSASMKRLLKQSLADAGGEKSIPPDVITSLPSEKDETQLDGLEGDLALMIFHQLQAALWFKDADARSLLQNMGGLDDVEITADTSADVIMRLLASAILDNNQSRLVTLWDHLFDATTTLADPYAETWGLIALLVLNQNWWAIDL